MEETQIGQVERAQEIDLEDVVIGAHLHHAIHILRFQPGIIERLQDRLQRHAQGAPAGILGELRLADAHDRCLVPDRHLPWSC